MKRPEGFDKPATPAQKPAGAEPRRAAPAPPVPPVPPAARPTAQPASASTAKRPTIAPTRPTAPAVESERAARRALRQAARERRRFERGEVKRFTRRSRNRRTAWLTVGGVVVLLGVVLAVAVYSPLLALKTVTVDGTSRVSSDDVATVVSDQLGTPLALLDYARITKDLAAFPLIRSYVTEMVPPHTLAIHIVERTPVGALQNGEAFDLVDPAGIVVQSTPERPDGVPLIDVDGHDAKSAAYASVVEVLLALPPELLAQVDTISASTKDDVSFVLRGVGQSVVWGSADNSVYKAGVLAAMVATQDAEALLQYDVSAPGSVVVTPR